MLGFWSVNYFVAMWAGGCRLCLLYHWLLGAFSSTLRLVIGLLVNVNFFAFFNLAVAVAISFIDKMSPTWGDTLRFLN